MGRVSFLQSALFVARKDLWYLLRQRETLLWTFAMPPVFFFFIGTVTGGMRGGMVEQPSLDVVAPEPSGFLADGLEPGAEHREADEFMELHTLRWSQVLGMIERGEVADGKTLVSLLFVQAFRR